MFTLILTALVAIVLAAAVYVLFDKSKLGILGGAALFMLVFIFESYSIGVLSTIMVTFINVIELLVATIQAYVFTLFSAMYIGSAVAEHHHDDHH